MSPTGVGLPVQRLDTHLPHQRGNVSAPGEEVLLAQQVPHHPAARKRMFEVQLVDAAHQMKISVAHRSGLVVDAAPAYAHRLCLAGEGQPVTRIDHRFALSKPAFASAPSKKSFSRASSPILA